MDKAGTVFIGLIFLRLTPELGQDCTDDFKALFHSARARKFVDDLQIGVIEVGMIGIYVSWIDCRVISRSLALFLDHSSIAILRIKTRSV